MISQFLLLGGLWVLFLAGFFLFVRGYALEQKKADSLWHKTVIEAPPSDERRHYERRYIPVSLHYASLEQADFQELTLTEDVGKGGIRFPASHPLRQGSRLYLSLRLPKESPLSLFGEVVWQSPRAAAPPRFDTGLKFVDLSPSNIIRIARHL